MRLTTTGDLDLPSNAWGTGPTTQFTSPSTAASFSNNAGWNNYDCPSGEFVCGLALGHIINDQQYWTGARLSLRCCKL